MNGSGANGERAPARGGFLGDHLGRRKALLLFVALAMAGYAIYAGAPANIHGVWRSFPSSLRWLLLSDIFIRTCEGPVDEFVVIWMMTIGGLSAPRFGALVAVQVATSKGGNDRQTSASRRGRR